ncbi:MAG: hypothetical protein Q8M94_18080, partial [Ignavibacteria bacterium]|nr:hypothetical protein [Ignavibacteria bacterium]
MNIRIILEMLGKPVFTGFLLIILCFNQNVFGQNGWYVNTSVQLSGGNYILDSYNRVFSFNGGLRYQGEGFGVSVSVPVIGSNNNSTVQNPPTNSSSPMMSSMNYGLGDIYGYFDYRILSEYEDFVDLYFNSQIKIPTASSKLNIGTDEYDIGISISLKKTLYSFITFVDLGYLNIGDPSTITYKNPLTYGFGIGKLINYGEYSLFIYYNGYTKIVDKYDAPQQVSFGANYKLSEKIILSLITSAGIGNFAPD